MRRVGANHAEAEDSADLISIRRLKPHGHLLFALNEICRNRIIDVEEMNRTTFLNRLLADFLAFHENVERSLPPLIAVVTHHQSHRVRWINGKIEREPVSTTAGRPAHHALGRRIFALHIEIAFGLHLPRLSKSDCRLFKLMLALAFSRDLTGFLFPTLRREQVTINSVGTPMQPIERNEVHICLFPNAIRAELSRSV